VILGRYVVTSARSLGHAGTFVPTKPLLFMHVPKSAGSSFVRALLTAEQAQSAVSGFDRTLFGNFSAFDSFSEQVRHSVYLETDEFPKSVDFVGAHMSFSTLTHHFPEGQLVTILREPISRLLSLWLYWRSTTDDQLEPWGSEWGARVRSSRCALAEFLRAKEIACQTDNQVLRMLLWPHPLIPIDDFIDDRHDTALVQAGLQRLCQFSFLDLIENQAFESNITNWLRRPITLERFNETGNIPQSLKTSISDELTAEAWALLDARSRLDLELWLALAAHRVRQIEPLLLRREAVAQTISRHSLLMAS
jgi:hypothetical protein